MEARSALLDFYSSRAVAHASYFMASIFGIVALLTLCQNIGNPFHSNKWWCDLLAAMLWFGAYSIFAFLGWWTLHKFGKYATYADKLREYVFIGESHLEKISYIVDKKDMPTWEQFFNDEIERRRERVDALRQEKQEKEANKAGEYLQEAKKNLKQMHDEGKFSFEYFDIYWGQEGKIASFIKNRVLVGKEEKPVKSIIARVQVVSRLTATYWLLILFIAGLAIYLILGH